MTAGDTYRALWRRKLLILALTALCVGVTWIVTERQAPLYQAETLIRIQQRGVGSGQAFDSLEASQRLTQTYAQIIEAGALTPRIEALLRGRTRPPTIQRQELGAKPVQDLELLTISARSREPGRSALIANAAPDALRQFNRETGTVRDQVVTVAPAPVPVEPASPNLPLNLALALLLGLIANCGLALLLELLSDRLPDPDALEESMGVPVLGTVPPLTFPAQTREPLESSEESEQSSETTARGSHVA